MTKTKQCQDHTQSGCGCSPHYPSNAIILNASIVNFTLGMSEFLSLPGLQALQLKDYETGIDLCCWVMEQCHIVECFCFVMRSELCMLGKPTATTPTYIPPTILKHSTANNFQYPFWWTGKTKPGTLIFAGSVTADMHFLKDKLPFILEDVCPKVILTLSVLTLYIYHVPHR
jgi:hypothetical protein